MMNERLEVAKDVLCAIIAYCGDEAPEDISRDDWAAINVRYAFRYADFLLKLGEKTPEELASEWD